MFSTQSLILDAEEFSDAIADHLAKLLSGLTQHPRKARDLRSSVFVSFEKLGVDNPARDQRARAFLLRLRDQFPALGYFLHGDPPTYHLRDVSTAIAMALTGGQAMGDDFVRVHASLQDHGAAFGITIGDDDDVLDEVFVVNLLPMVMPREARFRAMRALLPALLLALESPDKLMKASVREAEALWDRKLVEFPSFAAFAAAFQRSVDTAS